MTNNNRHQGSTFDDFLREEDMYAEAASIATARVLSWQLQQQMDK